MVRVKLAILVALASAAQAFRDGLQSAVDKAKSDDATHAADLQAQLDTANKHVSDLQAAADSEEGLEAEPALKAQIDSLTSGNNPPDSTPSPTNPSMGAATPSNQ